jgi:hypothetical protein
MTQREPARLGPDDSNQRQLQQARRSGQSPTRRLPLSMLCVRTPAAGCSRHDRRRATGDASRCTVDGTTRPLSATPPSPRSQTRNRGSPLSCLAVGGLLARCLGQSFIRAASRGRRSADRHGKQ